MSIKQLVDLMPEERRKVTFHTEDSVTRIETRQDVTPIIKAANALWEDKPPLDMRRVALIPKTELDRAFIEGWFHDQAAWKRWANDPANACYRTTKGTI